MQLDPDLVPDELALRRIDEHRFEVVHREDSPRDVINGTQLMGYAMIASALAVSSTNHTIKSAHGVFLRPVGRSAPVVLDVEQLYAGRAFGSDTVTVTQNGKVSARVQLLSTGDEPDLIRHADAMPAVVPADECAPFLAIGSQIPGLEFRVVGTPDFDSIDHAESAPELNLWVRATSPVKVGRVSQAVLCTGTGTSLIGTALLAHSNVGQIQAHRTISTGVVGHTINFHEPVDLSGWLLLAQESIYAGRGRAHGRARVFDAAGQLIASYTQDSMIRNFTDGRDHTAEYRTIM